MDKAYEPNLYEDQIYKRWEESGFFNPDNLEGEPYSIMMPPPNVTGVLHLGHALENSLMDVMARYQRMQGKKVLLLPGTDHAAVATQARVEKNLIKEGMKNPREELGRDGLLEKIREYAEQSKATILKQIKKMGTSADWSRLAYTFDEERGKAVNEVFKKMYDDGLIYRGFRVVNWSVKGQSTASDDELIYIDRKAKFYTFKYSKDFPFTIATTRPETKLGDTAVAVNPDDKRYQKYIGQVFDVSFCGVDLKLKIIGDEHVDPEFGTGALGVTPAHSPVDFEMYEKQKVKNDPIGLIKVIGIDGKMTSEAGVDFVGKTVLEARDLVVEKLKAQGLLEAEEEIEQNVGTSDRFGDVVESIPMDQWWLDVNKEIPSRGKSLRDLMREALTAGLDGDITKKVNVTPERFTKLYLDRVDNLRDWCLSRQIWWGHRIPVWYKGEEIQVGAEKPDGDGWVQDEDTLDTWFSSGLWTFSTLGWPEQELDVKTFHPTNWMQMGYEILYLWLMRMVLMSTYNLGEIPFKDAYIHGMLRDKDGQKFSKSSGNGIDPLEVIEKYGTDALRWSLLGSITPGNDSRFYLEKVEGAQHFVNKLWNISRFIMSVIPNPSQGEGSLNIKTLADKWILSRLSVVTEQITTNIEKFQFSQAGELLRDFTWNELADWYLEIAKIEGDKTEVLNFILNAVLKMWHPFMPFVTEQIWTEIYGTEKMLMVEKWPKCHSELVSESFEGFELIKNIITGIRSLRAENKIEPVKKLNALISAGGMVDLFQENAEIIKVLARLENLQIEKTAVKPEGSIGFVESGVEVFVDLSGAVDIAKEKVRLEKEKQELDKYVKGLAGKLGNQEFVSNAPPAVVEKEQQKLTEVKDKLTKIEGQLNSLK
ncbi:MAG TPA: valine--tRNA ligase [Candidatus Magasanikbacteria bacterium]|nr:valine--tRNA ligase [Candidatus Magasanikbacteria bacterium]